MFVRSLEAADPAALCPGTADRGAARDRRLH